MNSRSYLSITLLLLLLQCSAWESADIVVELANAHLLSPGDYRLILNTQETEFPSDCFELYQNADGNAKDGLYIIKPGKEPVIAYCDMQSGGWTVIQHITVNSTVDFDRSWEDYKQGFGFVTGDHWLGNQHTYELTNKGGRYKLGIKLVDMNAEIKWGEYDPFRIEDEELKYKIRLGFYEGNAVDALTQDTDAYLHDNQKFTTKDSDNDNYFQNCAKLEYRDTPGGGWWYDSCAGANLNRRNVIYWQKDCNKEHLCKYAWMMVKPSEYRTHTSSRSCHRDEL